MVDLYTVAAILIPVALGAIKGYTWYAKAVKYDRIVVTKLHEFRILVDDTDNAVQAGTIPSKDAVDQLWRDVLELSKKEEPAPVPATVPASTPSA